MAGQHIDRYDDITLQIAHRAQRAEDLYADDARRAYQRRQDEMSLKEALSAQVATTSRVASDAMQLNTAVRTPTVTS